MADLTLRRSKRRPVRRPDLTIATEHTEECDVYIAYCPNGVDADFFTPGRSVAYDPKPGVDGST